MKDESCSDNEDLAVGILETQTSSPVLLGVISRISGCILADYPSKVVVRSTGGKLVHASTAGTYANHRPSHPLPKHHGLIVHAAFQVTGQFLCSCAVLKPCLQSHRRDRGRKVSDVNSTSVVRI